jgi:hypothetical protein
MKESIFAYSTRMPLIRPTSAPKPTMPTTTSGQGSPTRTISPIAKICASPIP